MSSINPAGMIKVESGTREIGGKGGAQMKKTMKVTKGIGKVLMALLTGILMPILLWVGLGVALNQKLKVKKQVTVTAPTIGEILNKNKITVDK